MNRVKILFPLLLLLSACLLSGCGRKKVLESYPSGKPKLIRVYGWGSDSSRANLKREETFYFNGHREIDARFSGGQLHGPYASYWHNGQKKASGKYVHGKREGTWEFYFNQYQLSSKGDFHSDLETGPWNEYWENGELKAQGAYRDGKKIGDWKEWSVKGDLTLENSCFESNERGHYRVFHESRAIKEDYDCRSGLPTGSYVRKDPDGVILEKGSFDAQGRKEGVWETFHPGGQKAGLHHYRAGKEEDSSCAWDEQGRVRARGFFSGGTGTLLTYDSLGGLEEKQGFREGKPDGEDWRYFPGGVKRSLVVYAAGDLTEMRKWHDNGQPSSVGFFKQGKREGEWKQWDEKGGLREVSHYAGGLLHGERLFYDSEGKLFRTQWYEHGFTSQGRILKNVEHP